MQDQVIPGKSSQPCALDEHQFGVELTGSGHSRMVVMIWSRINGDLFDNGIDKIRSFQDEVLDK